MAPVEIAQVAPLFRLRLFYAYAAVEIAQIAPSFRLLYPAAFSMLMLLVFMGLHS
jgi:hypothetical protein